MVLALGAFMIAYSSVASVPVPINYLVESFRKNPQEVGTCLNVYRLLLGLIIPFFIVDWEARVGLGWVFGMMAFFSLFGTGLVILLIWKGESIRRWGLKDAMGREEAVS